jgi:hypothetical protein
MFTKQHYKEIAEIIVKCSQWRPDVGSYIDRDYLIDELAFYFKEDNPNFDAEKFWEAVS